VQLQIKPGLRQVWRGPGTIQIGLDARHGTVLDGLTAADRDLIERLSTGLDAAEVLSGGAVADPDRARQLLRLLSEASVLVRARSGRAALARLGTDRHRLDCDARAWSIAYDQAGDGWDLLAARVRRRVEVLGAGRIGTTLASTLAAAGVGDVQIHDRSPVRPCDLAPAGPHTDDLGLPRAEAAYRAIARVRGDAGATQPARRAPARSRPPRARPDLVVLVENAAANAVRADRLLAADIPHLSVVIGEAEVIVGPLVRPGQGPCLRCLDLHRGDRDPDWPRVLAQLLAPEQDTADEETASAGVAASLAALQVLAHLDGMHRPAALAATLEIELPDGLVSRRPWPAHPACGCHWPPRSPAVRRVTPRAGHAPTTGPDQGQCPRD
jgi:bacteriocin biosynthesis cyclodehydratase domain-containing protein